MLEESDILDFWDKLDWAEIMEVWESIFWSSLIRELMHYITHAEYVDRLPYSYAEGEGWTL